MVHPGPLRDVRDRHDALGRDAMDAASVRRVRSPDETLAAYGEVVWSWRRDRGVDPSCLCGNGNGDNKRRSPGRARISRKAVARGRPGCPGCTCQSRVRLLTTHCTRCCGCRRRPAFPAPLCPGNLSECANGRLRTNRPLLELSPLRPKATEPVVERGTAPVSSSTRTVARASSPDRARKGVDDGTK